MPDFRVVLNDGMQWLIEVKNVHTKDAHLPLQKRLIMKREYREKLERYASATGGQLKLAIFWSKWRMWTLVSPSRLVDSDGNLKLDMQTALKQNELVCLGDCMIGTRAPIVIRFVADPTKSSRIGEDDIYRFTIADVQIFCAGNLIVDTNEKRLAWRLIMFGTWMESGPFPLMKNSKPKGVEFRWEPEEPSNQGFEIIGLFSQLFTNYYAERTLQGDEVVGIHALPQPQWLQSIVSHDFRSDTLPLWLFSLSPKFSRVSDYCDSLRSSDQ